MSKIDTDAVATHYTHGALLGAILNGVQRLGKSRDTVTVEDLGPVDEFHIGGRVATKNFLDQLEITADDHVLDVGCGLGGASRFVAKQYGCRVTGVDLTDEYIKTFYFILCHRFQVACKEIIKPVMGDQGSFKGGQGFCYIFEVDTILTKSSGKERSVFRNGFDFCHSCS